MTKKRHIWNLKPDTLARLLSVIRSLSERNGFAPTIDEIAAEIGWHRGTVQGALEGARHYGFVTWERCKSRTLRILD